MNKSFFIFWIIVISLAIPAFVFCQSKGNHFAASLKIGSQVWMADNLDVTHFRNGEPIMQAKSMKDWSYADSANIPAWCYPDFDESNIKLGKLYNCYAVNYDAGLAPKGWSIPTDVDWDIMVDFLGDEITGGIKLQAVDQIKKNKVLKGKASFYNQCPGSMNLDGFWGAGYNYFWWSSKNEMESNYVRSFSKWGPSSSFYGATHGAGFPIRCIALKTTVSYVDEYEEKYQILDSTYNELKIGNQIWSERNLSTKFFKNGDTILFVSNAQDWQLANEQQKPAWCYYDDKPKNGKNYGLMYNWYAVNDARGLAPTGWHIPSDKEWGDLLKNFDDSTAACDLKDKLTWWGKATNKSGLNIFAAGGRNMYGVFHFGLSGSVGL